MRCWLMIGRADHAKPSGQEYAHDIVTLDSPELRLGADTEVFLPLQSTRHNCPVVIDFKVVQQVCVFSLADRLQPGPAPNEELTHPGAGQRAHVITKEEILKATRVVNAEGHPRHHHDARQPELRSVFLHPAKILQIAFVTLHVPQPNAPRRSAGPK